MKPNTLTVSCLCRRQELGRRPLALHKLRWLWLYLLLLFTNHSVFYTLVYTKAQLILQNIKCFVGLNMFYRFLSQICCFNVAGSIMIIIHYQCANLINGLTFWKMSGLTKKCVTTITNYDTLKRYKKNRNLQGNSLEIAYNLNQTKCVVVFYFIETHI